MYGLRSHKELMKKNNWVQSYFPNFKLENDSQATSQENNSSLLKRVGEWIFDKCRPDLLDRALMNVTFRRWERLYGHFAEDDFSLAFKTNPSASKGHRHNYQKKIITRYEARMQSYFESVQIKALT